MRLLEFFRKYPTEQKCREKFKEYRLKQGVVCPHCTARASLRLNKLFYFGFTISTSDLYYI